MKKSQLQELLRQITRKILLEISNKDINARHPQRMDQFDKDGDARIEKMTLSNLKALMQKELRFMYYAKKNHDGIEVSRALDSYRKYRDEIKRRKSYINAPAVKENTSDSLLNITSSDSSLEPQSSTSNTQLAGNNPRSREEINAEKRAAIDAQKKKVEADRIEYEASRAAKKAKELSLRSDIKGVPAEKKALDGEKEKLQQMSRSL